jgi:hypothetical protein
MTSFKPITQILFCLATLFYLTANANAATVSALISPNPAEPGGDIRYSITIQYSNQSKLRSTPPKTLLASLSETVQLVDYKLNKTLKNNIYTLKIDYFLRANSPGSFTFPPHSFSIESNGEMQNYPLSPPILQVLAPPALPSTDAVTESTSSFHHVSAVVSPNHITIGQPFQYTIAFSYDKSSQIDTLPPRDLFQRAPYDIILSDYTISNHLEASRNITHLTYDLVLFEVGNFIIPTHTIALLNTETIERYTLNGEKITVTSVLPKVTPNEIPIKDIIGLLPTSFPLKSLLIILGVLFLGVGTIIIFVMFLKKRTETPSIVQEPNIPIDIRPIQVRYVEKLDLLRQSDAYQGNHYDQFYIELIDILRDYLSERYSHPFSEMTTSEIIVYFESVMPAKVLSKLKIILNSSQLVKFARITPNHDFHNSIIDSCIALITDTSE